MNADVALNCNKGFEAVAGISFHWVSTLHSNFWMMMIWIHIVLPGGKNHRRSLVSLAVHLREHIYVETYYYAG